jgi:hypothetical protein
LPILGERDGSIDGAQSPCLRDDAVTLVAENQHFFIFKARKTFALMAPSRSAVRIGAPLAEVA